MSFEALWHSLKALLERPDTMLGLGLSRLLHAPQTVESLSPLNINTTQSSRQSHWIGFPVSARVRRRVVPERVQRRTVFRRLSSRKRCLRRVDARRTSFGRL